MSMRKFARVVSLLPKRLACAADNVVGMIEEYIDLCVARQSTSLLTSGQKRVNEHFIIIISKESDFYDLEEIASSEFHCRRETHILVPNASILQSIETEEV